MDRLYTCDKCLHEGDVTCPEHYPSVIDQIAWLQKRVMELEAALAEKDRYIHQLRGELGYPCPGDIPPNPDIHNGIAEAIAEALEEQIAEKDKLLYQLETSRDEWKYNWRLLNAANHKAEERVKELEQGKNKRFREMEEALAHIYESRATHCQGCKEHGQIAKAALMGE
jgi:hypothetical protein